MSAENPGLSPEEELKALRKENRRLKRELETTGNLAKRTDEYYRTSERVLTKAYKDLEDASARSRELQEELTRTAKLATVGEMAARVVHEVLNPMTSLLGRIQGMIKKLEAGADSDPSLLMDEILSDWAGMAAEHTFDEHLKAEGEDGLTLFDEDLQDLKTLLKTIQEGRKTSLDDLKFLERTTLHTVKIVSNMRAMARNRTELTQVNLNDLLVDSLELLRDLFKRQAVTIEERYSAELPDVLADPSEMVQIFTNILRNAQQAIVRGGTIQIETRATADRVEVRFTDNGPGISMPADKVELIFESGFSTKPQGEGSGLGLAICRRFARKYHGDVRVEWTSAGEGTTFLIWLPRKVNRELLEQELRVAVSA